MSSIITALIIISVTVAISWFVVYIGNRYQKKKRDRMLRRFSRLGSEHNMSFTSQEILNDCIIGIDGIHKKMLVITATGEEYKWMVIDLLTVRSCAVTRLYHSSNSEMKQPPEDGQLQRVVLRFDLEDGKDSMDIPFFDFSRDHVFRLAELEQKAGNWHACLDKLIKGRRETSLM
jgi:hypothetical protein